MKTISEVIEKINEAENYTSAANLCYELIEKELTEMVKESGGTFIDFYKKLSGYGTWKITVFCNQYHFLEYTEFLLQFSKITHDEDYSIESFVKDVCDYIDSDLFVWIQRKIE
jgi:hypothetical protein